MWAMTETIRVNFGKPIPLFPLPETVLLPHTILPLQIFEPRYRQMVGHCLDQAGQIAIGTFATLDEDEIGPRPVRTVACVGQIVQHEQLDDGRYNILLHGVCRARIDDIYEPDDDRYYRVAKLVPVDIIQASDTELSDAREAIRDLLSRPRLQRMRGVDTIMEWVERDEVPTHALLELVGGALVRDAEMKYRLLEESDPHQRAKMIELELRALDDLVRLADGQSQDAWPKGMSWN
jgi:Lon protease-like protein